MRVLLVGLAVVACCGVAWPGLAEEMDANDTSVSGAPVSDPAAAPADAAPTQQDAHSEGILPIPDYTGNIWNRRHLTGDWGGWRTRLAEMGSSSTSTT